jgi:hypothetical protein
MAKGIKTGGGSRQGKPNKSTQDVREAIALIAQRNVGNFETWIGQVAATDPYKAADLFLKAIEYHIPKLARSEITGKNGGDIMVHISNQDADLV